MKIFKHRNLMGLIFSVLLALPLISIGVRCGYVMWNKNAKDSYSDNLLIEQQQLNTNDLISYETYVFTYKEGNTITSRSPVIYYNSINIDWNDYVPSLNNQNVNGFNFYPENTTNKQRIKLWYNDTEILYSGNIWGNTLKTFTIEFNRKEITANLGMPNYNLYLNVYETNKLDNAFSYSVNELIKDNNFGVINFVGLFDDLFLDSSNQVNALYLHFANWYMNYVLFISIVYILFLVLMWFINFIRKMLEQGMDFGSRGY